MNDELLMEVGVAPVAAAEKGKMATHKAKKRIQGRRRSVALGAARDVIDIAKEGSFT